MTRVDCRHLTQMELQEAACSSTLTSQHEVEMHVNNPAPTLYPTSTPAAAEPPLAA